MTTLADLVVDEDRIVLKGMWSLARKSQAEHQSRGLMLDDRDALALVIMSSDARFAMKAADQHETYTAPDTTTAAADSKPTEKS